MMETWIWWDFHEIKGSGYSQRFVALSENGLPLTQGIGDCREILS